MMPYWFHKSTCSSMKIRSLVNSWSYFVNNSLLLQMFWWQTLRPLKWFECFSILIGCYVIKKISTTKLSRFFGKFVNFNGYNFFTSHGFFADKTEFLSIGLGTPWSIGWRWHHSCPITIAFPVNRIDYIFYFILIWF